jgi:DNA repair protein RadD
MQLRNYQRASIDALRAYWNGGGGHGLIVLPTGAGKSLVLAAICQEIIGQYPTLRICVVSHIRELLLQNYQELIKLWPNAPAGLFSAGLSKRDTRTQILIAGIQSVWNKTRLIGGFDILLIDEVHLVSKNNQTTYGKFITALKEETPDMRMVGLSASPWRMDSGRLDRGKDRLFDKIVYEANVSDLIDQGYLCPLVSKATTTVLDVSGVGKRGGEYIPGQLEIAVDKDWLVRTAVKEIAEYGQNRKSWLAFCAGVKHAEHVRDAIRALGFSCEMVTGETPKNERDRIIQSFRQGHIRCLTSVNVVATGFNVPAVDLVALLRPTASAGLYLQQAGRALRKAPGKENALILDFAGLVKTHGPIDMITAKSSGKEKDEKAEPLAKECPKCHSLVALAARECPDCGFLWPERDELHKHEALADATTSILSKGKAVWVDVDRVLYYRHEKQGSPPSLRAEYHCGFTTHREWLGFQHHGLMRQRAEHWWKRVGQGAIPATVDEALKRRGEIKEAKQIQVEPDGKYFRVVARRFERVEEKVG